MRRRRTCLNVVLLPFLSWIMSCVQGENVHAEGLPSMGMREENVTFFLYTHQSGPEEMFIEDSASIQSTNFDQCAETIFIITGLNQVEDDPQLINATKEIAGRFFNIVVVNFFTFSYVTQVKYTAAKISSFIDSLENYVGADRKHISLLGISLGAHIAGAVGKISKVSRIIALDPSGPWYDLMPKQQRLDSSDAELVEVVHSSDFFGTRKLLGHVDFIINGGKHQPNCEPFDFYCHHVQAAFLYQASVTTCEIYFRQCFAYWAFKRGLCDLWPRLKFGLDIPVRIAKRRRGRYYYDTSVHGFPYCSEEERRKKPTFNPIFC